MSTKSQAQTWKCVFCQGSTSCNTSAEKHYEKTKPGRQEVKGWYRGRGPGSDCPRWRCPPHGWWPAPRSVWVWVLWPQRSHSPGTHRTPTHTPKTIHWSTLADSFCFHQCRLFHFLWAVWKNNQARALGFNLSCGGQGERRLASCTHFPDEHPLQGLHHFGLVDTVGVSVTQFSCRTTCSFTSDWVILQCRAVGTNIRSEI